MSVTRKADLVGRIGGMEEQALHTFLICLVPGLSTFVRGRDPKTLNEAINHATSEEKMQKINTLGHPNTTTNTRPRYSQTQNQQTPYIQRNTHSHPQNQYRPTSQTTCNYCKILGHTINQCRKREYNNRRRTNSQTFGSRPNFHNNNFRPHTQMPVNLIEHNSNQYNDHDQARDSYDNHNNAHDSSQINQSQDPRTHLN